MWLFTVYCVQCAQSMILETHYPKTHIKHKSYIMLTDFA